MSARDHWRSPTEPGLNSLCELLLWTKSGGAAPAILYRQAGSWQPISARQFYERARAVAGRLAAVGAEPGARVALLAESRPEWLVADAACLAAGVIDVPIYPTLTGEQIAYILRHSGASGLFVSSAEQAAKMAPFRSQLPALRWLCCFDGRCPGAADHNWAAWQQEAPGEPESNFDRRVSATPPDRAATLIYTSGTTGVPKGVWLTHGNLCANLNVSTRDFDIRAGERRLAILPLAHITERHVAYVDRMHDSVTCFAESLETVKRDLLEVRPHALVSVPRLFEKVAAGVQATLVSKPAAARRLFAWAQGVGRAMAPYWLAGWPTPAAPPPLAGSAAARAPRPPFGLRLRASVADRLVFAKLRAQLGGRLYRILSGGAALAPDLAEFLLSLGVVIDQGYGLTETSPVVALNRPGARRLGSVGRVVANIEARLDDDGELLLRGPSVFHGYFDAPEETAASFRAGWFCTGDIGRFDEDGYLFLTDRKKDLIKTSGGKYIAPQPIESQLKRSAYIAEAVVVGNGRNYATALLVPNFAALEAFAASQGWAATTHAELCRRPEIVELIGREVDGINRDLARFETIKRFTLLDREFTLAGGELTPTVKVRRRSIEANFRAEIERMYGEPPPDSSPH